MRIIVRDIYRAFPELDRFDDERCERFIAAATKHRVRRAARALVVGIVGLTSFVCLVAIAEWGCADLWRRWGARFTGTSVEESATAAALAIGLATSFLIAMVFRDVLLRRRIATIIRDRARCLECGYTLLGLPLDGAGIVICPECGTGLEADPALGELVDGGVGGDDSAPPDR